MIWKIAANVKVFIDKCKKDNINAYAAQIAFFIILSSIPFLMVFSSLLQYTPVTEGVLLKIVSRTMPDYIAPFMVSIINEVYNKSVGLVSVAAVLAIWSAAKGIQYMANGLNVVNELTESRNWFVLRFWAIIYTIVFVVAITVTLVILVFGNSLQDLIIENVPLMEHVANLIIKLRGLVMLVLLILLFDVIFALLPNRNTSFRTQLPGAVLCGVAWYIFSFGLSIYVNYFNGLSMYGSLTTIVLIMLWMYFCMYILMVCAEINVVFAEFIERWLGKKKKRKKS